MVSILRKIAERFNAKRQEVTSEKVFVAAFGKHPGWDDHIDDIGLETDVLVAVKRILYIQGIGGNVDSGSWDRLQENQRIEEFRHVFVWCMDGNVVVGRMWSSRDGKGRTSYPMVVCVQCCQLPAKWVLESILPRLEGIQETCVATTSAEGVRTAIESAREEFRQLAQQCQPSTVSPVVYPDALAKLAEGPEMGPNREGVHRILYHLERSLGHFRPDKGKALRPTLFRVPASTSSVTESTLPWVSFLLAKYGRNTSVLVLKPVRQNWMDIILGEPAESQLYCLRATVGVIPLTSSIPYNMDSEFIDRANQLIESSRDNRAD